MLYIREINTLKMKCMLVRQHLLDHFAFNSNIKQQSESPQLLPSSIVPQNINDSYLKYWWLLCISIFFIFTAHEQVDYMQLFMHTSVIHFRLLSLKSVFLGLNLAQICCCKWHSPLRKRFLKKTETMLNCFKANPKEFWCLLCWLWIQRWFHFHPWKLLLHIWKHLPIDLFFWKESGWMNMSLAEYAMERSNGGNAILKKSQKQEQSVPHQSWCQNQNTLVILCNFKVFPD